MVDACTIHKACSVGVSPVIFFTMKNRNDWFKVNKYPHIGLPLKPRDRTWVYRLVSNKEKVAKYSFLPFIHRELRVRRFRRTKLPDGRQSKKRELDPKKRDIHYAGHIESNIYSYYSRLLLSCYNNLIEGFSLNEAVTAYRKLELKTSGKVSRNKCNIDFANEVFTFVAKNESPELAVITFDIKSFFDNLDHAYLKKMWKLVISSPSGLPADHYNVYRNVTKFSYINETDIFKAFKNNILVENSSGVIKNKSIPKFKYLKEKNAVAFCNKKDIHLIRRKKLIKSNKYLVDENKTFIYDSPGKKKLRNKGIPQGSPISAVLANIYMIYFDKKLNDYLTSINGIYRRYSDDMIIACEYKYLDIIQSLVKNEIDNLKLSIQDSKTKIFKFTYSKSQKRFICQEYIPDTESFISTSKFEYLGFQFDGKYVLLKNASLSRYYRRMKRAISASKYYSLHNKTQSRGEIFKTRLYKRFTINGSKRRRTYKRHPVLTNKFIISDHYDWGNYLSYALLASKTFPNNKIRNQIKRHWRKFHEYLEK